MRDKRGHCIECRLLERRAKEAVPGFKERQSELHAIRIANNQEAYKKKTRERMAKRRKIYLEEEREKGRLFRQRERLLNPEKVRIYAREYYKRNSIKIRLRNRLYRALKDYMAGGKVKSSSKYGINYVAIIIYLGPQPTGFDKWHIDHIRPLSSFDFNDPQQIKEAFSPQNHQWLKARDNLIKHDKYAD
jgi:hypothetical protein